MRKNVGTFGEKKPVWHRERDFLAPLKIKAAVNKSCKTNPHNMYICIPGLCDNTITDCDIDFDVLLSQHLPILRWYWYGKKLALDIDIGIGIAKREFLLPILVWYCKSPRKSFAIGIVAGRLQLVLPILDQNPWSLQKNTFLL